jgi:hypothetical protein
MAQEIGRRSVTVEAWIRFHVLVRSLVDRVAVGRVFYPSASVFRCQYRSTSAPYSSSTCCSYEEEKWVKPWNFEIAVLTFFGP